MTEFAGFSMTVQVAVAPLHPPAHSLKVPPDPRLLVKTALLIRNVAEQAEGQLMPVGALVTDPLPEPLIVTTNENVWVEMVKVCVVEVPPPGAGRVPRGGQRSERISAVAVWREAD